jgi:FKBP-type peptidyl-prolyl cis-trans isomerase SlyD
MQVAQDSVVVLTYELRVDSPQGELIQKVDADSPFAFLFGHSNVIKDFETNLNGKKSGDHFSFRIDSEFAYGPVVEEAVVELSRSIFDFEDKAQEAEILKVGNTIPMLDQSGNRLEGIVLAIQDETVKMDFNHPLAGVDLHFSGQILEVREASNEELAHGHAHGSGGHQH